MRGKRKAKNKWFKSERLKLNVFFFKKKKERNEPKAPSINDNKPRIHGDVIVRRRNDRSSGISSFVWKWTDTEI